MDDWNIFNETYLTKKLVLSSLSMEDYPDADYKQVEKVGKNFEIKTFKLRISQLLCSKQ